MKTNPYLQYNYQVLKSFEAGYEKDVKDSTLTRKEQANARKLLKLVREAMKTK